MTPEYYFSEDEIQEKFDEIMNLVEYKGAHIFITRNNEPILVLIPYNDYEYYQSLIEDDWKERGEKPDEE